MLRNVGIYSLLTAIDSPIAPYAIVIAINIAIAIAVAIAVSMVAVYCLKVYRSGSIRVLSFVVQSATTERALSLGIFNDKLSS